MSSELSREALSNLSKVCGKLGNRLKHLSQNKPPVSSAWGEFLSRRAQRKAIKQLQPQLHLIVAGTQDALRHPVALVGYLDGFEARSRFDEQLQSKMPEPPQDRLHVVAVKDFVVEVLAILETVFDELAARDNLRLSPNGPSKPGPKRTVEVAELHLEALCLKVEAAFGTDMA